MSGHTSSTGGSCAGTARSCSCALGTSCRTSCIRGRCFLSSGACASGQSFGSPLDAMPGRQDVLEFTHRLPKRTTKTAGEWNAREQPAPDSPCSCAAKWPWRRSSSGLRSSAQARSRRIRASTSRSFIGAGARCPQLGKFVQLGIVGFRFHRIAARSPRHGNRLLRQPVHLRELAK